MRCGSAGLMMRSTRRAVVVVVVVDTAGETRGVTTAVVTVAPHAVQMTIRAALRAVPAKSLPLPERYPVAVCLLPAVTMEAVDR